MQKKLCLALSLSVVCYWAEASPVSLGALGLDQLNVDLNDLKYEALADDLKDFSKMLDESDYSDESDKDKFKTSSEFKKKNSANKGLTSKYNIEDLKKIFKAARISDQGTYDVGDIYAAIAGIAAGTVGAKGTEERKYRKGSKTRGFHRVHHKDEYKKDKEFYEDDEVSGDIKKVGGRGLGYKIGVGAGIDKGHFDRDYKKRVYGKEGYEDNGYLNKKYSGYSDAQGFDGSYENDY